MSPNYVCKVHKDLLGNIQQSPSLNIHGGEGGMVAYTVCHFATN